MTIDEAISHAREVAECQKMSARLIEDNAYIPESVDKEAITYGNTICANEHEQLAEWLEEMKQYRAIGTSEECLAAEKKQKAKKMESPWCPCCGKFLTTEYMNKRYHCIYCGQLLEWEGER